MRNLEDNNSNSLYPIPFPNTIKLHMRIEGEGKITLLNKIGILRFICLKGNESFATFIVRKVVEEDKTYQKTKILKADGMIITLIVHTNYSSEDWFSSYITRENANFTYWFTWEDGSSEETSYPYPTNHYLTFAGTSKGNRNYIGKPNELAIKETRTSLWAESVIRIKNEGIRIRANSLYNFSHYITLQMDSKLVHVKFSPTLSYTLLANVNEQNPGAFTIECSKKITINYNFSYFEVYGTVSPGETKTIPIK